VMMMETHLNVLWWSHILAWPPRATEIQHICKRVVAIWMLIIIMQIKRRQWPTSSLGTLNLFQELRLFAICVGEERERKKAT
jgi:hypothetical protein